MYISACRDMPLPSFLVEQIRALRRAPSEWFSIEEIRRRDKELEIAARYIQKGTGKELVVRRSAEQLYEHLEQWAARLLEYEVRSYEERIWNLYSHNLYVPTPEDDGHLYEEFTQYIKNAAAEIRTEISRFSNYVPPPHHNHWSKLRRTEEPLISELSATTRLRGEIFRLESIDKSPEALSTLGYAQVKIERFFSNNCGEIYHPFLIQKKEQLGTEQLQQTIRFLTYVIFKEVDEPRLKGFEQKFVTVFLRYLTCSRESSGAIATIAEQVSGLIEPFLKKTAFLFFKEEKDEKGTPLWHKGLAQLIKGLNLSSADLKKTDESYWIAQKVPDAVLRVAFKLRNTGTHEAHSNPPYENEKYAYFVFAALVLSSRILVESHMEIKKIVDHQGNADAIHDLFVKIEELATGPDGPRTDSASAGPPNRLQKLVEATGRAEAIWPNCSVSLRELLESEYLSVKSELEEADREADIEAYLDSMRDDEY